MDQEIRLVSDDHSFLAAERRLTQADWSVNVANIVATNESLDVHATDSTTDPDAEQQDQQESETRSQLRCWLQLGLVVHRDFDVYIDEILNRVVDAMIELLLALPLPSELSPVLWMIRHLRLASSLSDEQKTTTASTVSLLLKTNYELMRTLDTLKVTQCDMHERLERLEHIHEELALELEVRNRFISKLSESHVTTRTAMIMEGTPVAINEQKHWVLPGYLLVPSELPPLELQGLVRAEQILMEKDEVRWKSLLRAQLEYDASTAIQRIWRGHAAHCAYLATMAARRRAATIIQRNYFHYLFHRAIALPPWCQLGREVMVAPSIAQKCGITFQFYAGKDFPAGNYERLPKGTTISEMMNICREDERCAAFSTDGALKRFVPRQLSQLKAMVDGQTPVGLVGKPGLYIKIYPAKDAALVTTAIVTGIPDDRFGLVEITMDGLAVVEQVPVTKLSDRWKRVRIKRYAQQKKRAVVFGRTKEQVDSLDEAAMLGVEKVDFERVPVDGDDEDEDVDDISSRRRRLREQANERYGELGGDAVRLEYVFEDRATLRIVPKEPKHTFSDAEARANEVAARRQAYEVQQAKEYEAKVLASAVRLQCAWRSKRARESFRHVLELRIKERERAQLVDRARIENSKRQPQRRTGGLFTKWRRG